MNRYTIIIPTRDRVETLVHTLRTCTRQTYRELDIIVSDNCSEDDTRTLIESCKDPRVRYINPGRRLSMSGNFEFALSHARDGFIMIIGSDDGVLPGAIEAVDDIVRAHDVLAVSCRQATYVWPDFKDANIAGRLIFGDSHQGVEIRDSKTWIQRALNFQDLYTFDLPNLYCGFAHRSVIDRGIKDGVYFRSITPDAYASFALALHQPTYAFSHTPFVIAGASTKSNGASAMHASADGAEAARFRVENDIPFHSDYDLISCFEVFTAEAFSQAADAFPESCSGLVIDRKQLLAGALFSANAKTSQAVTKGVESMAKRWGIPLSTIPHGPPPRPRRTLRDLKSSLSAAITNRLIGVRDSRPFHVQNIDDAALLAGALMAINRGAQVQSTRSTLWRSLSGKLGLPMSSNKTP